jgi:serpin B
MHRTPLSWMILFLLLALAACGGPANDEPTAEPPGVPVTGSDVEREPAPDVPGESLASLTQGNRRFAFDLFQALRDEDGNLFFSPYSISAALAMTYAGASGETAQQMAGTLHFELPDEELHAAFNALDQRRAATDVPADEEPLRLEIANSLWAQEGFPFEQEFVDLLARHYGAGLRLVDFVDEAAREQARQAINDWVEQQTEDKIQELIAEGVLTPDTRLVLANAIYFLGKWVAPFAETGEQPFTLLSGEQVTVAMMSRRANTPYYEGDGFQALALDYQGGDARMILLVPDPGQYEAFETSLDEARFAEIVAALETTEARLVMPKFEFESEFQLNETLEEMGMPAPFDRAVADFSAMSAEFGRDLYISAVIHKAFVAVDEEGTEAAAATAVVIEVESAPELNITVDGPFLFAIHDEGTGSVLFLGRVLDPRSE